KCRLASSGRNHHGLCQLHGASAASSQLRLDCGCGDGLRNRRGQHWVPPRSQPGAPTAREWKHLFHVDDEDIAAGEDLIRRRGALTIFFARYIFGLRTIAGPLAGVLRMDWKRFVFWNALGAASWVSAMVLIGYAFGHAFNSLLDFFEKADLAIMAGIIGFGIYFWRRYKKRKGKEHAGKKAPKAG